MKVMLMMLTFSTIINSMQDNLQPPNLIDQHKLPMHRRDSQLPQNLFIRPEVLQYLSPAGRSRGISPRDRSVSPLRNEFAINMSPISPEEVHVEEVRANAIVVRAMSKKKIACLVAVTAITSSVLTAGVTLTIHFTSCQK